jgi:hypothetical protein
LSALPSKFQERTSSWPIISFQILSSSSLILIFKHYTALITDSKTTHKKLLLEGVGLTELDLSEMDSMPLPTW